MERNAARQSLNRKVYPNQAFTRYELGHNNHLASGLQPPSAVAIGAPISPQCNLVCSIAGCYATHQHLIRMASRMIRDKYLYQAHPR